MTGLPVCPSCGSLAVGERCGSCGTQIERSTAAPLESIAVPGLELDGVNEAVPPALESRRQRQASAYLALQHSEEAVLHAASRIFAAYVASGAVTEDNQAELSDRSVMLATRMALVVEKYVQSDDEDW